MKQQRRPEGANAAIVSTETNAADPEVWQQVQWRQSAMAQPIMDTIYEARTRRLSFWGKAGE
jgi:hypothetical protein